MNVNADNAPDTDDEVPASPPSADEPEAAPAKPVRRKRAAKPAVEAAPPPEDAPAQAESVPAEAAEPPAKPVRRRRAAAPKKQAVEASEAVEPSEPVGIVAPVETVEPLAPDAPPAQPVEAATVPASDAPSEPEPQTSAANEPNAPVVTAHAEHDVGSALAALTAQETPPAPFEPGERGRRRGRRERRRGGRGEADQAAEFQAPSDARDDDDDDDDEVTAAEQEPVEPVIPANPDEVFAQVVSGEFDVEGDTVEGPPLPFKRVLRPDPDAPKLHKVLAQAGVGSRRDMEELILDGKITVNGQPAHIGQRISFGDHIKVDGKPVRVRIVPPAPRIIAYHKPAGEVVTHDDPQHRPTVFRRLPRLPQGKWQSVGRLDMNTEGLLLFTNSGELANQLMHPRFGVEREYAVRVLGTLDEESKAELLEGVNIDGQPASFRSIEDGGGEGANHWYRVVITEGRNREVRRMFDEVGLTVSRLIRIRYGTVVLPRGLKRGVWVDLDDNDVRAIRRLAGGGEGGMRDDRGGRGNQGGRGKQRSERRNDRGNNNGPRNGPRNRPPEQPVRADFPQDRGPRDERDFEGDDDIEHIDHSKIPNPLEQTFDKRFVQNPRSPAGGRGFGRGGGGFGAGGSAPPAAPKKAGGPREPDPLQTSVGYIGGDAFHRKGNRGGGGRGGNRGGGGYGGGGGGGGGGGFGGGGGGGRRGR